MSTPVDVDNADAVSAGSSGDSVLISVCPHGERDVPLHFMLQGIEGILAVFLVCSLVSFCSSRYTLAGSQLNSVLVMCDVVCVHAMSALFVCTGFMVAYLFLTLPREHFADLLQEVLVFLYTDIVIAHTLALVVGLMWCVDLGICDGNDAAVTVVEGLSGLRVLDMDQTAWHSINMAAWPMCCLFWCVLLCRLPLEGMVYLHRRMGLAAVYLLNFCALMGVLLLNAMSLVHRDSDMFYMNSTNLPYRIQEFGIGINVAYLLHMRQGSALREVLGESVYVVLYAIGCAWWGEVGGHAPAEQARCPRMYARNNCLPGRHALLMRGGVVGLVCMSSRRTLPSAHAPRASRSEAHLMRTLCTAVSFCWPVYIMLCFAATIVFGASTVSSNAALLSAVMPVALAVIAGTYDHFVKPHITRALRVQLLGMYYWCEAAQARLHAWRTLGPANVEPAEQMSTETKVCDNILHGGI